MASRKPSANAKRTAAFKAGLGSMDDVFERECARKERSAEEREEALVRKACWSKNCYGSGDDAAEAARACAAHGAPRLHCYRCPHCGGWHLTSKPER